MSFRQCVVAIVFLFQVSLAKGQALRGTVLRMEPTILPTTCNTGDIRIDSSDSYRLKICVSNNWTGPMVSPMTTDGDMIYQSSGEPTRLAIGAANTILKSDGVSPAWGQIINTDVSSTAAIAYSKLNLTASIVAADVSTAANLQIGIHVNSTVSSINGIDYNPSGDTDTDLITVNVTGSPTLSWDESNDGLNFTHGLNVDSGTLYVDPTNNIVGFGTTASTTGYVAHFNGTILVDHPTDIDAIRIRDIANSGQSLIEYQNAASQVRGRFAYYNSTQRFAFQPTASDAYYINVTSFNLLAQRDLRFEDAAGGEYIGFEAPGTIASSFLLTLPSDVGSAGQALVTDGVSSVSWSSIGSPSNKAYNVENIGLKLASTSGSITATMVQADGTSSCTSANPCIISIDDGDGSYTSINVTADVTLTLDNGATLGTQNGIESRLYFYALNETGNVVMGVSNRIKNCKSAVTTTVLDTSADGFDLYTDTALTSKRCRLLSVWYSTQAAAGTWSSTTGSIVVDPMLVERIVAPTFPGFDNPILRITECEQISAHSCTDIGPLWTGTITDGGVGISAIAFTPAWSTTPYCWAIDNVSGGGENLVFTNYAASTAGITFRGLVSNTGTSFDANSFIVFCLGGI